MVKKILTALLVTWGIICLIPTTYFTWLWLSNPTNPMRNEYWIGFGICFGPGLVSWIGLPMLTVLNRKIFTSRAIWFLNLPSLLAGTLFITCSIASHLAPPIGIVYLIPKGYAGWLSVTYNAAGNPPLPVNNGLHIVRFPETGVIETSTPPIGGDHNYFYYSKDSWTPLDLNKELGGGGSVQRDSDLSSGRISYEFWVSRDAKRDFELYVKDKETRIGPFPNYQVGQ